MTVASNLNEFGNGGSYITMVDRNNTSMNGTVSYILKDPYNMSWANGTSSNVVLSVVVNRWNHINFTTTFGGYLDLEGNEATPAFNSVNKGRIESVSISGLSAFNNTLTITADVSFYRVSNGVYYGEKVGASKDGTYAPIYTGIYIYRYSVAIYKTNGDGIVGEKFYDLTKRTTPTTSFSQSIPTSDSNEVTITTKSFGNVRFYDAGWQKV
jgi:hypothetical protein